MNELDNLSNIFRSFSETFATGLPRFAIALVLLIIGWLLAKFVSRLLVRILQTIPVDALGEKIKTIDFFANLDFKLSSLIGKLFYWVIMTIFFTTAAETMGLTSISDGIKNLLAYLPKLLSAAVFFVIGALAANGIKAIIDAACASMGLPTGKIISLFVFYFLIVMISITTLNQAGLDTQIITQNVSIATAAIFFAFSIAYGFASRDILANLLASFYSKDKFSIGQRIRIDGIEGEIIRMDSTSVTLNTAESEIVMPLQKLLNSTVEILK